MKHEIIDPKIKGEIKMKHEIIDPISFSLMYDQGGEQFLENYKNKKMEITGICKDFEIDFKPTFNGKKYIIVENFSCLLKKSKDTNYRKGDMITIRGIFLEKNKYFDMEECVIVKK